MANNSQNKRTLNRTVFRTKRLLDFCTQNGLSAEIGHPVKDWPLVVAKELIANGTDACEDKGILPVISVSVDIDGITVTDNGPGLSDETIQGVLDPNVRVSSRETYVSPTRGAQGNALKTLVFMPYVLDGECGRVQISSQGLCHSIAVRIDQLRQEPAIDGKSSGCNVRTGTSVRLCWPDSASSILHDAKLRFLQIADDYTFLNPHLNLSVNWFGDCKEVKATEPDWSKWLPKYPTSVHWYDNERFKRYASACISHDMDRSADRTVREFVAEFAGLTATTKQKAVLEATWTGAGESVSASHRGWAQP
jgi:DNA topoisomerase VI subunit B